MSCLNKKAVVIRDADVGTVLGVYGAKNKTYKDALGFLGAGFPSVETVNVTDLIPVDIPIDQQIMIALSWLEAVTDFNIYETTPGAYRVSIMAEGDWKHTHAFLDSLMRALFNTECAKETVIEDTESDWYTAEHEYLMKD